MSSPSLALPRLPLAWHQAVDLLRLDWAQIPSLPPFLCADGRTPAIQQTSVRPCADERAMAVYFKCLDRDIWGGSRRRDDPIYEEEVVELFLAPGSDIPIDYFEFEVSPNGILFDAKIHNPNDGSMAVTVDCSWDCPGVRWQAARWDSENWWEAVLYIPWLGLNQSDSLPASWRGNFCRIERPRDGQPEFSCWSPTMTDPANFHRPEYFGTLLLPI
ncbi:MAG: carbohydrate-binding family 9-like protein [Ardenticatenaceae bacterium]|nr:carbohydrate-binding family 9-like protein [Ardenticatenaceae bacterium]